MLIGYDKLETLIIKSFTFSGINETRLEHSVNINNTDFCDIFYKDN